MDPNVPPPPKIDRLLALLEGLTPWESGTVPGVTATQADVDAAEKDSPDKGEPVGPGPWPTFEETSSSSSPAPKG
ncbi:benzoate 4-monooxygenase cytochrome P450 [Fusarium agapanthi]|uniref:Benzoate 4-monooxygenase cytochrome P450 n=1 Tax=Fusarium agapanthi TaxID=1803897 RepID=A0A9P5EGV8_9HYPO|nr:benzoate 4-monooxygenase cytochrome P450 [Fusarium agapanthi]